MAESPLEARIYAAQSRGDRTYVSAWSDDGRYALVIYGENAYVATPDTANGIGRWECTVSHLRTYRDVYATRFPCTTRPERMES